MKTTHLALSLLLALSTLLLLSCTTTAQTIQINELMYNPTTPDATTEWIELYNAGNTTVNLTNWTITDNQDTDIIQAYHPNTTTLLQPYHYAILTDKDTTLYTANHSIPADTLLLTVDDNTLCGYGLNNEAEILILKNRTNHTISNLEYGEDSQLIAGYPTPTTPAGYSIIRHPNPTHNDSITTYTHSHHPSPGQQNIISHDIDLYAQYIAHPHKTDTYSQPTSIHLKLTNLPKNQTIHLKAELKTQPNNAYPASQSYKNDHWTYSNNYTNPITTTDGNWSGWMHLRLNNNYAGYQDLLNQTTLTLQAKIKTTNHTFELTKYLKLLNLTTTQTHHNTTQGGLLIGAHNITLTNTIALLKDTNNTIQAIYPTENNTINDDQLNQPGYYKLPAPIGTNYSLTFTTYDLKTIIATQHNLSVTAGYYHHTTTAHSPTQLTEPHTPILSYITLKNTGTKNDSITITCHTSNPHWSAALNQTTVSLHPQQTIDLQLEITPPQVLNGEDSTTTTLQSTSTNDAAIQTTKSITTQLKAPDLLITKMSALNSSRNQQNTYNQGESLTIKAHLKNQGNIQADHVTIAYYLNTISEESLLGKKTYDNITTYTKYPQLKIDTTTLPSGPHKIIAIADSTNTNLETNEYNNKHSITITLLPTHPTPDESQLLITELHPSPNPGLPNEYIIIHNPTNHTINLTNYYLTTTPTKTSYDQHKIIFSEAHLLPNSSITLTQNATAYHHQTNQWPTYEYTHNSTAKIPQLITTHTITLPNSHGEIALKNPYNHTIDYITYDTDNTTQNSSQWSGTPIPTPKTSELLLRRKNPQNEYIDTNTAEDWIHPQRITTIGQSRHPHITYTNLTGSITTFISPDNSYQAITTQVNNAQESIYFNIYELTSPALVDTLINALKRNVKVFVFIEGSPIGGICEREAYLLHKLHIHGAAIQAIIQDTEKDIYARYTYDHAKYLIIDNHTTIIESCNWVKTGISQDPTFGNREWGIIIANPLIAQHYLNVFMQDFNPQRCDSANYSALNLTIPTDYYPDYISYGGSHQPCFQSITAKTNFNATPVFSPDNSHTALLEMINSATESIYIQQLYIHTNWTNHQSPLVDALIAQAKKGVDVRIMLNYNPAYGPSNIQANTTKKVLEEAGANVRFLYTNWSIFSNLHNKGMVVDNKSVLISSINWNENSIRNNREAGIIIDSKEIATYYSNVFFYDWTLEEPQPTPYEAVLQSLQLETQHLLLIAFIYSTVIFLVIRDWRARKWISSSTHQAQQASSPSFSSSEGSLPSTTKNSPSPSDSSSSMQSSSSSPLSPGQPPS